MVNDHVGSNAEYNEDQHRGYGYGVRNNEEERILEFCAAMNMKIGNTIFQKRSSHLITYESGPSKTEVDYYFVWRNKRKFFKDIKILPIEECITEH